MKTQNVIMFILILALCFISNISARDSKDPEKQIKNWDYKLFKAEICLIDTGKDEVFESAGSISISSKSSFVKIVKYVDSRDVFDGFTPECSIIDITNIMISDNFELLFEGIYRGGTDKCIGYIKVKRGRPVITIRFYNEDKEYIECIRSPISVESEQVYRQLPKIYFGR